ncbi:hypothetical protein EVAR_83432_1 [Eumeta japonica]|uniref:Uncharacterized protein n=1 Tax=Eumeta variegata TaxID=151549 RepID=A0A4C1TYI8_EUMVA|nr:hypothetical protein EVAR_83432_1 [Eumeta japonica]
MYWRKYASERHGTPLQGYRRIGEKSALSRCVTVRRALARDVHKIRLNRPPRRGAGIRQSRREAPLTPADTSKSIFRPCRRNKQTAHRRAARRPARPPRG